MGWRSSLRSYFIFNKRERRGIILLSGVLLVVIAVRIFLPHVLEQEDQPLTKAQEEELLAIRAKLSKPAPEDDGNATEKLAIDGPVFSTFDPNTVSVDELFDFGLPAWLAQRVVKYREKVKPFQSPEDLLVVYDMDTQWWEMVLPYIEIDAAFQKAKVEPEPTKVSYLSKPDTSLGTKKRKSLPKEGSISLNQADTNALMLIPGVGSFYAKSIVKLRTQLGGFRSFEQLLSVYKMRDKTLDAIARYTFIDTNYVQRININTSDVKALGMHPYLSWQQARAVVNYRKQHGLYRRTSGIMETDVIPDSVYLKIAPYLTTE